MRKPLSFESDPRNSGTLNATFPDSEKALVAAREILGNANAAYEDAIRRSMKPDSKLYKRLLAIAQMVRADTDPVAVALYSKAMDDVRKAAERLNRDLFRAELEAAWDVGNEAAERVAELDFMSKANDRTVRRFRREDGNPHAISRPVEIERDED